MDLNAKLVQITALVGPENVSGEPACLGEFAGDTSLALAIKPSLVVRPRTVADLRRIVSWANETGTPLVPVSSGGPHFHGDTVPSVAETVIVDLRQMKSILRIDRRNRIVVIEPGVTYGELMPALAAEGLRICCPFLPRANKSVIASLLERQPTTIPRLNYSLPEPLRVCGVVWGTGEYSFTGEAGSGPLSLEAQWEAGLAQVNQQGPLATDLMRLLSGAQGTMGIVVWASIKCELLPSVRKCRVVAAPRLEDLIDFCYRIERLRLGEEVLVLNRCQLEAALGTRANGTPAGGIPPWAVLIGLAGTAFYPEEKVLVQEHELQTACREFGLDLGDDLDGVSNAQLEACLTSLSPERYWKFARKGSCQDIFFLTTLDKVPLFVQTVESVAARCGYSGSDIGVYIQAQHQGVSQHVEFSFPFDPHEPGECEIVRALYSAASEALISAGAYFSRPYGIWADMAFSRDATASRVLRIVKQIVDPRKVMNPGRLNL